MAPQIPEIHPITDLARDARALVETARARKEPIVITQRAREVAVLVPIELYREMQSRLTAKIASPRLVHPRDAARFHVDVSGISDSEDVRADVGSR